VEFGLYSADSELVGQ